MGTILTGIIVAVVIAIGAGYVLQRQQEPAWQVYSTKSTRVDNPGINLVGRDWSGQPRGAPGEAGEEAASNS